MNSLAITFLLVNAVALLMLPRRWAILPLLVGTCYMTLGQGVKIGPFHFTIIRILVAAGLARVIMRGERLAGGGNGIDKLMLVWAVWALASSRFHEFPSEALIFRLGLVYNACGIYFLLRVFCQSLEDVLGLCRITAILLIPVAAEMVYEKIAFHNFFSVLGGVPEVPQVRNGNIRAFGPFAHPILAGTVGAVSLPFMIGLWQQHRKIAFAGIAASLSMIFASASSGPIMSAITAVGALLMWSWRDQIQLFRWLALLAYIILDLVMKVPAYYLLARIDLSGGSTGWHRAALIESSMKHLDEWWFAGTDYTVHWMPTGVSWSPNHTDITNHYLAMGVTGGLPLMLLFILILTKAFSFVGQMLRKADMLPPKFRFMVWTLGAALFAHAATCISVSYFDQSYVFVYLTLAAIGSAYSVAVFAKTGEKMKYIEVEQPRKGVHSNRLRSA